MHSTTSNKVDLGASEFTNFTLFFNTKMNLNNFTPKSLLSNSQQHQILIFPPNLSTKSSLSLGFHNKSSYAISSSLSIRKCVPEKISDSFSLNQEITSNEEDNGINVLEILKGANSVLPQVVIGSTVLALVFPPSFSWFTTRYYAPALGFLMFAVGVNSSEKDFIEAFSRPDAIFAGYIGQFVIKPLLGYLFGTMSVSAFGLPTSIGAGIMLTSCVSGAQLSNYATYLTDPAMAPLSIVMTSLSTATAVFVTPTLSLLLIGKKLPVDVKGMISSIMQIVIAPIVGGLLLNR
ncbi:hypothetical protein GIB67_019011 [Kingdonia uniflora]|uniref:Uncharacterized protein n=1 Tax=Kingdonia uniflora TaxID=39325 RepID=A0A7J7MZR6_9MAGN|nr:hypothetical protein GIB67_019011 [Kingdonia uniflora]